MMAGVARKAFAKRYNVFNTQSFQLEDNWVALRGGKATKGVVQTLRAPSAHANIQKPHTKCASTLCGASAALAQW